MVVAIVKKHMGKSPGSNHMPSTMPKTEQPVGFFSTFSIVDPNGTHEGSPRTQKRNRRVFVCIPCHRRKLKCDKGQPCSRCVQSGSANECAYQPAPESSKRTSGSRTPERTTSPSSSSSRRGSSNSNNSSNSKNQDSVRSCYPAEDGRAHISATTHWAKIACEFEEASPFIFGTHPQWDPRYRQIRGLKYLFSSFGSSDFPFSSTPAILPPQHAIISQLPSRHVVEALVSCYFQSCEVTHRLFHPVQFWDELHAFYNGTEQIQDAWLAQLFMVLALGCQTVPDYVLHPTGKTHSQLTEAFLEGAQICFGRSPYIAAPNLTSVRTLCLMVLAELLELVRGTSSTQIVSLMGFLTRLATTMQLHRTNSLFPTMSVFEAEMRRRTWVTIQLLDVDVAMRAGTSFLCRDHDAEAPLNTNETGFHADLSPWSFDTPMAPPNVYTDGSFQVKLAEFLPLVAQIIETVNSTTQHLLDYETVMFWDKKLRRSMREIESLFTLHMASRPLYVRASTQRQLMEVLGHRARLALHHVFIRPPYDYRFEPSFQAVKESSLALLGIQEAWSMPNSADSISSGSRSSSPSSSSTDDSASFTSCLIDLCHDDFNSAMMYLALMIRRDVLGMGPPGDSMSFNDMSWVALRRGLTLARERACRSLQQFKEFVGLSIMMTCLQYLGNPAALLPALMQVADDVEQTVMTGKQDMIWIENGSDLLGTHEGLGTTSLLEMDPELLSMHI